MEFSPLNRAYLRVASSLLIPGWHSWPCNLDTLGPAHATMGTWDMVGIASSQFGLGAVSMVSAPAHPLVERLCQQS